MHRARIEDDVCSRLGAMVRDARVEAAGSLLDDDFRLRRGDFTVSVPRKDTSVALASLRDALKHLPRGSRIIVGGRSTHEVGEGAGMTLVLPPVESVDYEDDEHVLHTTKVDAIRDRILEVVPGAIVSWQFTVVATDIHIHGPAGMIRDLQARLMGDPALAAAGQDVFA